MEYQGPGAHDAMTSSDSPRGFDPIPPVGGAEAIRAAADGERPPAAAPDDQTNLRIAFERDLREAVGRVMGDARAPAELRGRVMHALAAEDSAPEARGLRLVRAEDHPEIYKPAPTLRLQWWLAAAAAVALMAALVWFAPLKPSAGPSNHQATTVAGIGTTFVQVAGYVTSEHGRCEGLGSWFEKKMTARTETEAAKAAIELLPRVPSVLELRSDALAKAGYHFAGLGKCAVPGKGRSAHLLYKPDPAIAPDAPVVSLFVKEDLGDMELPMNCCLTNKPCNPDELAACRCIVTAWRKDGLIYLLVAPPVSPEIRRAFDAPEQERSIL